ncbi:MAG: hypothetical protein HDT09_03950 [Bacteroidales bacterium]|nr:hypothetical protein [Bacteroidales bacterium]
MKTGKILLLILLLLVVILAFGAATVLADLTLMPWWQYWGWSLAGAIVLSIPLRGVARKVTGWQSSAGNQLIAAVYITIVAAGGLYTVNYAFADKATAHTEEVEIQRKYTKTRHRSRRVGRRYVQGEPYKVYFIEVRFADGRTTDFEIPAKRYNRLRTGGHTNLTLATGLLGSPVIKL